MNIFFSTLRTSGIDPWIRSKYEHKQFAQKGGLPDPSELGPIDEAMLMDLVRNDCRRFVGSSKDQCRLIGSKNISFNRIVSFHDDGNIK